MQSQVYWSSFIPSRSDTVQRGIGKTQHSDKKEVHEKMNAERKTVRSYSTVLRIKAKSL